MNEIFGELRSALQEQRYGDVARELGYLRQGAEFEVALSYVWEHLDRGLVADRPLWHSVVGANTNPLEVLIDPRGLAWSWGGVPFVWIEPRELESELRAWSGETLNRALQVWGVRDPLVQDVLAWQQMRQEPGPFFVLEEVEEAIWALRQQLKARLVETQGSRERCILMASQWMSLRQAGYAAQGTARFLGRAAGGSPQEMWGWETLGGALAMRLRAGVMARRLGRAVTEFELRSSM